MYIKQGNFMVVVGPVSGKDAWYHEFESGARVADFSVRYDTEEGDEPGRKKGKYLDVKCWRDLSDCAQAFEKDDRVLVFGPLTKDKKPDQDGNDRWYVNGEFCIPQAVITFMVQNFSEISRLLELLPVLEKLAELNPDLAQGHFEEDAAPDDPLPKEFGGTNTEYGGGDYPEALE